MAGAVPELACDYLVVGTGAAGMSFVDTLLMEDPSCSVVMVDRQAEPGGHWNLAYEFVTLHQPASSYGVASERLEEEVGNPQDLSSGPKICAYYRRVMEKFVATGRVQHWGSHEYVGEESEGIHKVLPVGGSAGQTRLVQVDRKLVDGGYVEVTVPAMRKPLYEVAEGVCVEPVNFLAELLHDDTQCSTLLAEKKFCVVGGGKTGIDAVLYLLKRGAPAESITWIVPNDAYMVDRSVVFFGAERLQEKYESFGDAVHDGFVERGLLRLDPVHVPTKFRCCTVSQPELVQLRMVENVVRLGRVQRVSKEKIVLEQGEVPMDGDSTVYIDCTANGLTKRDLVPIFEGKKIILQSLIWCAYVFSASATAKVEASCELDSDAAKNGILEPIRPTEELGDRAVAMPVVEANMARLQERFPEFCASSRLGNPAPADWPPEVCSKPYKTA